MSKIKSAIYFAVIAVIILALNFAGNIFFTKDAEGELQVHFIDVGQGDSILIRTDDKNMLIDGGTDYAADTVVSYLESQKIKTLDIIVVTHPHEDHIGGLDEVIEMFDVGKIYMPDTYSDTETFVEFMNVAEDCEVIFPESSDSFRLGNAGFTVIAPNAKEYSETNNYSLCLRMTYGKNSFLFAGDAENLSEREIIGKGYELSADVLKVAHHGSKTSCSEEFINLIRPAISVISVGEYNKYGLPDEEVIERLEQYGKVYRTDINGNIVITSDGSNLEVCYDSD